jgi:hypothetical protein
MNPDSFVDRAIIETVAAGGIGAAFVRSGAAIAPAQKAVIAFLLGGVA